MLCTISLNYLVLQILNKQFIEEAEKVKTVPDLRPGDIVELRMVKISTVLDVLLGLIPHWMVVGI